MLDEVFDHVAQSQQTWPSMYQCYIVNAEGCLQLRQLVQFIQQNIGIGVSFNIYYDTHAFAVALVIGIGNTFYLLFISQVGYIFNKFCLIDY